MSQSNSFTPRPKQQAVLEYYGGTMGVSAVPGSGKTWTLSLLAADLIARDVLDEDQEILIVTLVNSAVDNFSQRVSDFLTRHYGLLPQVGYRVRTLHGLAHDIVRERPALVNLSDDFEIIDERAAADILDGITEAWLRAHPGELDSYLEPDLAEDESKQDWVRREKLPELIRNLAGSFIRYAKDLELSPERLQRTLAELPLPLPLAELGGEIYSGYERALAYRGAVDFDDLIRLALEALRADEAFLERLRHRWPYILEDEAQDSSRLQQEILGLLTARTLNWVHVGDPNQAIYETFTTASPHYLREFINRATFSRDLPNSGRSTQSIMDLANYLIQWTNEEHPVDEARDALTTPYILPAPAGDPQPNPADSQSFLYLLADGYTPEREIQVVADSLERWLPDHLDETAVVLVPRNHRGFSLADELRRRGIEPVDSLLRSTGATRLAAGAVANILQYLSDPKSARRLATIYQVWRREARDDEAASEAVKRGAELIKTCTHTETYLWPRTDADWLNEISLAEEEPEIYKSLIEFREVVRRWQRTILLPVDQMILTLAQDLFTEPAELAVAHKLAIVLGRTLELNQDWRLPDFTHELAIIARNERRFLGFSEEDRGFDPDNHKGQVVIATMHKAKGLEWDRVYLMSVNNYDFPSAMPYDNYISEKWFIRDNLNLEAEALAQLETALSTDAYEWYEEGVATASARLDYVEERLRLLYVGITRARRELVITWNTGRQGDNQPAIPLVALRTFWEEGSDGPAI